MNIVCIKHPAYDGSIAPLLGCKTCCMIFIATIKEKNEPQDRKASLGLENQ